MSDNLTTAWLTLLVAGSLTLPFIGERIQHKLSPEPVVAQITPSPSKCSDLMPGGASFCEYGGGNYRVTIPKMDRTAQSQACSHGKEQLVQVR